MTIVDPKFGGEILTKKGRVYKFDDLVCMAHFIKAEAVKPNDIARKLAINFRKQNDFIDVGKGFFLVSSALKTPMGGEAGGFTTQQEAETLKTTTPGEILTWRELQEKFQ